MLIERETFIADAWLPRNTTPTGSDPPPVQFSPPKAYEAEGPPCPWMGSIARTFAAVMRATRVSAAARMATTIRVKRGLKTGMAVLLASHCHSAVRDPLRASP